MRDGITVKSPPEMLHHYLTSGMWVLSNLYILGFFSAPNLNGFEIKVRKMKKRGEKTSIGEGVNNIEI